MADKRRQEEELKQNETPSAASRQLPQGDAEMPATETEERPPLSASPTSPPEGATSSRTSPSGSIMPTEQDVRQAQAESKVAQIAELDKALKEANEGLQFKQFQQAVNQAPPAIGENEISEAADRLLNYKAAKKSLDERIIENEQFFKLRHWENATDDDGKRIDIKPTGWLWNVILSKHADMMDGYPEPNILAKEKGDKHEAVMLSSIVPVIFETNGFHKTFNKCSWYKLIKGTAVYGIFWDKKKEQGKGDVAVEKIDVLNLFWEPGITDIQDSREVFLTSLIDIDQLEAEYPQTKGQTHGSGKLNDSKYIFDDNVDTSDKALVVDWYYKKHVGNKTILHYCKFVDNIVLYATENERQMPTAPVMNPTNGQPLIDDDGQPIVKPTGLSLAERGWYDHGKYPFVLDPLFSVEGSPCGYSYIDICKHTQEDIDLLNHAIMRNALLAARPRYFVNNSGSVNEDEFTDFSKDLIHCEGASVGEDSIRQIQVPPMPGNVISVLEQKIEELKETSGNRDVNNGSSGQGITAASAIAALQESAGKTSRDSLGNTYEAFKEITFQVIELIRQFYNTERQFRIIGQDGQEQFVNFSNEGIRPQNQGELYGVQLGYRTPQFDIEVSAAKATAYSKMSQNELALQFYQAGLFAPQNADQSLAVLDMMDFNHKNDIVSKIRQYQNLMKTNQMLLSIAVQLASRTDPELAQQLMQSFSIGGQQLGGAPVATAEGGQSSGQSSGETRVQNAREQTQNSTQIS